MTKVSILRDSKKIEFLGCLMVNCVDVNYGAFSDKASDPSTYDEIILIARNYGDKDVMLARKHNGEDFIMFGHFNDGVV